VPRKRTLARFEEAGHHVEGRRLAGSVRADQADDLAGMDVEMQVCDGHEAAKAHADMIYRKDRR
jgi:hypothetical protein